jgi:hypothetical protein
MSTVRPDIDTFCLDLKVKRNILALMALDTELNQLHRLCIEQGPFFKALFHEVTSDALRQGLKQRIPRQPENESHFETSYWKPTITGRQIDNIEYTIGEFRWHWTQVYNKAQSDIFHPQPADAPTPLSVLNTQILKLTRNIAVICQSLTPHEDVSKKWVVGTATTTANAGGPRDASSELSGLLAQLNRISEHGNGSPVKTERTLVMPHPEYWVVNIKNNLLEMIRLGRENPSLCKPELLHMCAKCLEVITAYHEALPALPHDDTARINRLYDTLVDLITPFYTITQFHKTEYSENVEAILRNIEFDLMQWGGLFDNKNRFKLKARI